MSNVLSFMKLPGAVGEHAVEACFLCVSPFNRRKSYAEEAGCFCELSQSTKWSGIVG
jgi:hypothetical protein